MHLYMSRAGFMFMVGTIVDGLAEESDGTPLRFQTHNTAVQHGTANNQGGQPRPPFRELLRCIVATLNRKLCIFHKPEITSLILVHIDARRIVATPRFETLFALQER